MKKTKRLLALLLTFAALVSLLAFTAAVAKDADCVAPCVSVSICPYCIDGAMYVIASYDETLANGKIITHYVSQCNSCGAVVTSD